MGDRPQAERLQAPPDSRSMLKLTIRSIMLHLELRKVLSSSNSRPMRPHSNPTIIKQLLEQAPEQGRHRGGGRGGPGRWGLAAASQGPCRLRHRVA